MFLSGLKLGAQPFREHAEAATLLSDERMEEGLARLEHLVAHGVLGLVTGPSGVGKSALLKRFLADPRLRCETAYCHLTQLPGAGILRLVVARLDDQPRRGKERLYEQILERARRAEGGLLLVFDEAHLLDAAALLDLRLLVSSALDDGPPLRILLAGQDALRATLRRPLHADLQNRVSVRFQLRPLTRAQTGAYIDHQLRVAGADPRLFDDSVKTSIHELAGGLPRLINHLATACLIEASARQAPRIDDALYTRASAELQLP